MILKLIFTFNLLLFSSSIFSINIAPVKYAHFVEPQIKGIIDNFFNHLKSQGVVQSKIINIYELAQSLKKDFVPSKRNHHPSLLKIKNATINFHKKLKELLLLPELNKSDSLKNLLLLSSNVLSESKPQSLAQIKHSIEEISIHSEIFITENIKNKKFSELYSKLWEDFISDLVKHVYISKNIKYFTQNIDKLNTSWHSFYSSLKANKKSAPKGASRTFSIIQNRWNLILKLTL